MALKLKEGSPKISQNMSIAAKAELSRLASCCVIIRARGHREVTLSLRGEEGSCSSCRPTAANRKDTKTLSILTEKQLILCL